MATPNINSTLSYSAAESVANRIKQVNPDAVVIISDVPQRGASKELAFRVTVWQGKPGPGVEKFTINALNEYVRLETALIVLGLLPATSLTPVHTS